MSKYHLSVLIPARCEYYYDIDLLAETITNVLANTSDRTEIIAVLDGYWPKQPLPVHSRVTILHHNQSIGQRAATNEAARIATGEYVMKLDAHCALDNNFDEKLLSTFEPHWTVTPALYNLLVFNWKCRACGWLKDQSPKPDKCKQCNGRRFDQVKQWRPRDGSDGTDVDRKGGKRTAYLSAWRFDTRLEYTQWGELAKRQTGPIIDTMSLLGACWAIRRERYFELNICDEKLGSWGQQGTEIACKTWLSGGELKCNTDVWFAHFFRVGGIGFPYPDGGRKERAMSWCRDVWLNNKWPKQIYPLSWLIDRFSPVPDWDTPGNLVRAQVNDAGALFYRSQISTQRADSFVAVDSGSEQKVAKLSGMPAPTSLGSTPGHIVSMGNKGDMQGIAAVPTIANEVIQFGLTGTTERQGFDQPSVGKSVDPNLAVDKKEPSVSSMVQLPQPDPATGTLEFNLREKPDQGLGVDVGNGKVLSSHDSASNAELRSGPESRVERDSDPIIITRNQIRKCALYYSCLSHDELLESAARANLKRSTNGHELGCVTIGQRVDYGDWNIVVDRQKSGATMHYQILAGLERSNADYVFLCESDVLYHPSHFEFTPSNDSTIFYNTNVWRVRWSDGHAVRTANLQQVSGICARRELLLEHYRKRVQLIEANGGVFDTKRMAYEPGTRGKFGNERVANWESPFPNLDITGHGNTLTVPHFSIDSFRNKKYAEGWTETDEPLPGWPKIAGRVQEWLREMVDGL